MSSTEKQIKCRRCRETISLDSTNCPHCGTSIRGNLGPMGAVALGLLLVVGAALNISELLFFGIVGLGLIAVGGYVLYDKRKRMDEASSEVQTSLRLGDETEQ